MTYPSISTHAENIGSVLHLGNDIKLYMRDTGSGHPVLLLHGVGCCSDDWTGPITHFRDRFRAIRPDARGHGRSSSPAGHWQLADFIGDLVQILDRLGIEKTHVAGFSMGGLLAQGLALRHADRVEKLAIIAATSGRTREEQAQVEERLSFIRSNPPSTYFDQYASKRWFTADFRRTHPEIIERTRRAISANDREGYTKAYEVLVRNDLGAELHRIGHKTLVLTGENDLGAGPKAARFIAGEIVGSHLVILPRLRHHMLLEAPELVGGILREFFSVEDERPLPNSR